MAQKRKHDGTAPDIGALEKERNELLVKQNNPKRLKEVNDILNYFHFGIKPKN